MTNHIYYFGAHARLLFLPAVLSSIAFFLLITLGFSLSTPDKYYNISLLYCTEVCSNDTYNNVSPYWKTVFISPVSLTVSQTVKPAAQKTATGRGNDL